MKQLTEFERGLIVGARMAGASVTRTAELLNVSRGTVSKVLTAFAKYGQTASAKRNCGRKAKLSDSERRALIRIVAEKHRNQTTKKTTTFDITTELNQNRCDPVSTRTVRRELGKVLEVLKHGMCGDIGNIPIHKAQALEKQGEEEEEEEEDDEESEHVRKQTAVPEISEQRRHVMQQNCLSDAETKDTFDKTKDLNFLHLPGHEHPEGLRR
uniref:Transposase Tc1-like domain-containing protein n=1 Tax=Pygocentrus nattereri TaxID=42514 RepID=A0A3B4DZ70_PYGNA